jgi:citrate lyase beta subunit
MLVLPTQVRRRTVPTDGRIVVYPMPELPREVVREIIIAVPPRPALYVAVGPTIAMLVGTFRPFGLPLTAPAFEGLVWPKALQAETRRDLEHGLLSKTAIHPDQVPVIEGAYRPSPEEIEAADSLLADKPPAVFRLHDAMCERATHTSWAKLVRARAELFGVSDRRA